MKLRHPLESSKISRASLNNDEPDRLDTNADTIQQSMTVSKPDQSIF